MGSPQETAKQQALKWLKADVAQEFERRWDHLASSGAVDAGSIHPEDFTFARCVLIQTAKAFTPISPAGEEMLSNLEKF